MSHKRLPHACGTVIKCDADGCDATSQTGQVYTHLHSTYLRTLGWLIRDGANQRFLCPTHGAEKRAEIEATKKRAREEKLRLATVRAERKRRDALTPEQRKIEDKQRAKERRDAKKAAALGAAA